MQEKTKLLAFGTTKKNGLQLYNTLIKSSTSATLLGTTLDQQITMKKHITDLAAKGQQGLSTLRKLNGWKASGNTLRTIYLSHVRPRLETGFHFTRHAAKTNLQKLQKIQNEALRLILRLPRWTNTKILHEEGKLPMIKEHLDRLHHKALKRYSNSLLLQQMEEQLEIIG